MTDDNDSARILEVDEVRSAEGRLPLEPSPKAKAAMEQSGRLARLSRMRRTEWECPKCGEGIRVETWPDGSEIYVACSACDWSESWRGEGVSGEVTFDNPWQGSAPETCQFCGAEAIFSPKHRPGCAWAETHWIP